MRKILSLLFAITLFGLVTSCEKTEEEPESKFSICDKSEYRRVYGSLYQYYCDATVYQCNEKGETVKTVVVELGGKPTTFTAHKDAVKLIIHIDSKVVLQGTSVELVKYWMADVYDLKKGETVDIVYDSNTVFSTVKPN